MKPVSYLGTPAAGTNASSKDMYTSTGMRLHAEPVPAAPDVTVPVLDVMVEPLLLFAELLLLDQLCSSLHFFLVAFACCVLRDFFAVLP